MFTRIFALLVVLNPLCAAAQEIGGGPPTLDRRLRAEHAGALAQAAWEHGDPRRGAILFHQPHLACAGCHGTGVEDERRLGPELAKRATDTTDAALIESILEPSRVIRKGYETTAILTSDGKTVTGLVALEDDDQVVVRDAAGGGRLVEVPVVQIEQRLRQPTSIMPAGLANQLANRQQFLDLARYVLEISKHGASRAAQLRPAPTLYAQPVLPDYERDIDHAGLIRNWDRESYRRGKAIYERLCINCHGTKTHAGSLPTSLRFASGTFKNGSDPYGMYRTLTYGFGMMLPQAWMVPQQKYDVIHYIREEYLKSDNPSQYKPIDNSYLTSLPAGNSRGPEPKALEPWMNMDYGPNLISTYEVGRDGSNFAHKGIAVRLDAGSGGVSRGRSWIIFDHDTLRMAAAWSGTEFIDWNCILFNGRHGVHPRIGGTVRAANPTGPGWGRPTDGSFEDPRLKGRDDKRYGPLPRDWAHYRGLYHYGDKVIVSYTVGETSILEMPGMQAALPQPVFRRTFQIGPRQEDMLLQVAHKDAAATLRILPTGTAGGHEMALFVSASKADVAQAETDFDGESFIEVGKAGDFDMTGADYSICARVKTEQGGSIFARTAADGPWAPDGKSLFVRDGNLVFDIGWVGAVSSQAEIDDGRWHDVAMTWERRTGLAKLYVDGKLDGQRRLRPKHDVDDHVVRLGFTAPDFPEEQSFFDGRIEDVRFYGRLLRRREVARRGGQLDLTDDLIARWQPNSQADSVPDTSGNGHHGRWLTESPTETDPGNLIAGLSARLPGAKWLTDGAGNLQLKIPGGDETLRFSLWFSSIADETEAEAVASAAGMENEPVDLELLTQGGPRHWATTVETPGVVGDEAAPFAVDVLMTPDDNPWLCRVRPTGFDFVDDQTTAVCTWDGDVWRVQGIDRPERGLTWQRIASGLFQPLGLKVVDDQIYVTCRDQVVILRDLNGDGETDYYENFNNDHQVTEHFHEFAMGLQIDEAGNFYYAKSARHALPAIVPHHGTLLRVSRDGARTDILANGFRAANGVCLNSDGTFIVTDQEGHWNPKNRINWVREGGFYGNMYGYHDVTDASDDAMEQPLCWITNSFDHSPAELLWVDSDKWGPLEGCLLNFSYGYGKIFVVPHEELNGQKQGGMCELPMPQSSTGLIRGRFHPGNGQLYTCGMFAWAGSRQQPGGFYRVRYTGKPVYVPIGLNAKKTGIAIEFAGQLDRESAGERHNYSVRTWSLKRTAEYGSDHYNERELEVAAAELLPDGRTVVLHIPQIEPTWCMQITYKLNAQDGEPVEGMIHNTIHNLAE